MIDVGDIVNDPDLAQAFTIERSTGQFVLGGWKTTAVLVPAYGCITVASPEDLEMVPEGDRLSGAMLFHTSSPLYITELEGGAGQQGWGKGGFGVTTQQVSDVVVWRGQRYRVVHLSPYQDYGYYRAVAVRMAGR